MKGYTVSDRELRGASGSHEAEIMARLSAGMRAKPNGGVEATRARLTDFESRYGMSTQELRGRVYRGEQRETDEIGAWLMTANLYDRLVANSR